MFKRILVPVDGSPTSDAGLAEAIKLAKLLHGQVRLVHVIGDIPMMMGAEAGAAAAIDLMPAMREGGQKVLAKAREQVIAAGVAADTALLEAMGRRTSDVIVEEAKSWQAELLVIGTHGRRGMRRALLGSDAEQVLRVSPVPVLLIRGSEG